MPSPKGFTYDVGVNVLANLIAGAVAYLLAVAAGLLEPRVWLTCLAWGVILMSFVAEIVIAYRKAGGSRGTPNRLRLAAVIGDLAFVAWFWATPGQSSTLEKVAVTVVFAAAARTSWKNLGPAREADAPEPSAVVPGPPCDHCSEPEAHVA
jgi:hypothetical protein